MRVTFISTYPPATCGIGAYSRELIAAIRASDPSVEIEVVTENRAQQVAGTPIWPTFDRDDDYVAPLLDRIEDLDADVVHIQHEYGIFGIDRRFHELLAGLRHQRRPAVVTLHTVHTALSMDLGCSWRDRRPPPADLNIEQYQRDIGAAADAVVVHQEASIRQVLVRQGLVGDRVITIPHGTPMPALPGKHTARATLRIPRSQPLLIAFGYFEPAKNHTKLIEALSLLRADIPDVRLLIGGHIRHQVPETTAYRVKCEQLVGQLDLESSVEFLDDPVPDDQVVTLLAAADVACFAYDEDTRSSSGALHWAIGCGVPFVASRIAKFAEVADISDELLVNPRSPSHIAGLIRRLLSDDSFRSNVRLRGVMFADATSWRRSAQDHIALYSDLATADRSHRRRAMSRFRRPSAAVVA